MKKIIYIAVISSFIWSCGGSGGDEPTSPENQAPSIPSLVYPTDNLLCIDNVLSLQWDASTDDDDNVGWYIISYEIQVATDNQFSQIVHTSTSTSTTEIITLEKGIAYYWRVKAIDSENLESEYSSTFHFYTEGDGSINHIPFSPELVSPELGDLVQTVSATLQWDASDVDVNDVLMYDLYYGTDKESLSVKSSNQTTKVFETTNLDPSSTYYWKVVVKDGNGGETVGQVWQFSTD